MKKTYLLFILLIICTTQLNAQWIGMWEVPVALSDSTSDNCNSFLFNNYYNGNDVVLFWDRSTDTMSTALWMDNLMDQELAEMILSEPGVHFTHPKVITAQYYPYPDSVLYVLYETNQNGNQDIYYIVQLPDGNFTDPTPLALGQHDDTQLSVGREYFYDAITSELNIVAWISNGDLYSSILTSDNGQYFSDPILIDSADCNAPCVEAGEYSSENILYEKTDSSGSFIYQIYYNGGGLWSLPMLFFNEFESLNPTRAGLWEYECWSSYIDTAWRIVTYNGGGFYDTYDISSQTPFDPAILGFSIGVDAPWLGDYVAITYPDNGIDEIFMAGTDWGSTDFVNFSNSGTMNRNPRFYGGEGISYGVWCDYIIWESYRNGHWQLWSSKAWQSAGSISEDEKEFSFITTHPNPFSHETNIEFTLNERENVTVDIYNSRGTHITSLAKQSFDQGEHLLRWNAHDLPAGMYIIKMTIDGKVFTSKVVKSQ